jgi:carboxypeptidase C (cathepsin A)
MGMTTRDEWMVRLSYASYMKRINLLPMLLFMIITPFAYAGQQEIDGRGQSIERVNGNAAPEASKATKHSLTVQGKSLSYTALAGSLAIDDAKGKPIGNMFSVAYVLNTAASDTRPVTFFFNGGPPAAGMWLHMASLGPVRVVLNAPGQMQGPPFTYVPNEYSLLDDSDLVFIDAPLCGFSRSIGDAGPKDFEGTDEDIAAFKSFITKWLNIHQRWNSPKYLFGESYGGTRAAALVAALNDDGVTFNGVTLESPVLNYNVRAPGYDTQVVGLLPTYAAVAYFYGKAKTSMSMVDWVQSARKFARGDYKDALDQGDALADDDFDRIAARVAEFTGLSVSYVRDAKLRVDAPRFRKELLRADHKTLGRYDARVQGEDVDSAGEVPEYDEAESAVQGPILASLRKYLATDLGYVNPAAYYPSVSEAWNWQHRTSTGMQQAQPDVAVDLSDAMRKNPGLKVFVASGYFDLSTPFATTEYDVHHMLLPNTLTKNIRFGYYEAGHMVYLNVSSLQHLKADLHEFYFSK